MKLTIKRSEWLRGEGDKVSTLLRSSDNKKCCLGFLAIQLGATEDQIRDRPAPLQAQDVSWPNEMFYHGVLRDKKMHSHYCQDLMQINDYQISSQENREFALKDIFQTIGIEVEFVD